MEQKYVFADTNDIGTRGQRLLTRYLSSHARTQSVVDVSGKEDYQHKGIDLLWSYAYQGMTVTAAVEVKTDTKMHVTGNFFFETVSNEERGKPGWALTSEAAGLAYISIGDDRLYWMMMPEVREFTEKHRKVLMEVRTSTKARGGEVLYHTKGLLVPKRFAMSRLEHLVEVREFSQITAD